MSLIKKRVIPICFFLLLLSAVSAQTKDTLAVKYGETITAQELNEHLSIIASDEYEGRETAEKGSEMAAEYLAGQFKNDSLPPVVNGSYFQEFPLVKYSQKADAIINGQSFHFLDDFVFFSNLSSHDIEIEDMVFAGYGLDTDDYNDYEKRDVEGKSVLVFEGEPVNSDSISYLTGDRVQSKIRGDMFRKMELAEKKKVKQLFVVIRDFETKVKPFKNYFGSSKLRLKEGKDARQEDLLTFIISEQMARALMEGENKDPARLVQKINRKGKPKSIDFSTHLTIKTYTVQEEVSGMNVLGYIEGSDLKDELVVLTAHYDHLGISDTLVYNGADDDGSGTVGLIEIAEAFALAKKQGHGPRRSVLVMPVSGEEKGLLGSKYYTNHPVFPLENTVADLNIDMIGRVDKNHIDDPNYVYLIGSDRLSADLHNISEWANSTYVDLNLDYTYNSKKDKNNFYRRSDHYNFAKNNVPVIFYFNGTHDDYHQPTDTVDKIDFNLLKRRTQLVFYTAWHLANADHRPRLDKDSQ